MCAGRPSFCPGFQGDPGDEGDSPGDNLGEGDAACDSYEVERVSAYRLNSNLKFSRSNLMFLSEHILNGILQILSILLKKK